MRYNMHEAHALLCNVFDGYKLIEGTPWIYTYSDCRREDSRFHLLSWSGSLLLLVVFNHALPLT